ncbi:hypothetical protein CJO78_12600 [Ralstonia solanacearum]|nr:hypothetical protein CJO76_12140 [Ralstonia solanacearum]AXV87074.1 hypothetical protein CJO78_12600 [Ralstonia solanacearum]AXV91668.1 hypothetical protein CJO79_12120 [Ralstonia solanacearum]AXW06568.1 hypothetical protein CJO82_12380 [Ralstonia solanacearum]AXW19779.1 hypothetical protein CJO85_12180 [Ralstonia solanacearum]
MLAEDHGTWNLPVQGGYTPAAEACASAATDVRIVSNGITQTVTQIRQSRYTNRICAVQTQKSPARSQSEPGWWGGWGGG